MLECELGLDPVVRAESSCSQNLRSPVEVPERSLVGGHVCVFMCMGACHGVLEEGV